MTLVLAVEGIALQNGQAISPRLSSELRSNLWCYERLPFDMSKSYDNMCHNLYKFRLLDVRLFWKKITFQSIMTCFVEIAASERQSFGAFPV